MSNRFKPADAKELAARGLNPDGTVLKKAPAKKKAAPKKEK